MPRSQDVTVLYAKAVSQLELALATPPTEPRDLAGIIKSFEFCFELSWKALQVIAREEGREVKSPRQAFSEAYKLGLIQDPVVWAEILKDRNLTVHTYDEEFAKSMSKRITDSYVIAFQELKAHLERVRN